MSTINFNQNVMEQLNKGELEKKDWALIGVVFGVVMYPLLPLGFKFFSFIFPVICLSIIYSSKYDSFNVHVFFMCLFFSFLLPTNAFIFDARTHSPYESSASSGSSIYAVLKAIDYFISLVGIAVIAIPVFLLILVIWAAYKGNANKAATAFARLLITVGFTIFLFSIFEIAGIGLNGMTKSVLDFYTLLGAIIFGLPMLLYELVDLITMGLLPDLPMKSTELFFDASNSGITTYNSLNYTNVVLTISDLLPIFAIIMCAITYFVFLNEERAERIEIWITKLSSDYICPECGSPDIELLETIPKKTLKQKEQVEQISLLCTECQYKADPAYFKKTRTERKFHPTIDFSILIVFIALIGGSFIIFLSYSNYFQNSFDSSLMWRYIGFFAVYLPMAMVPLLLMLLSDKFYYKRSNVNQTIKGTVYGYFGLWLLTRLFFARKIMDAYSAQGLDVSAGLAYLLEQTLYVGPAETLFFTVFCGSIVATFLQSYTKENLDRGYEEDRIAKLQDNESKIKIYETFETNHKTDLAILDTDIVQLESSLTRSENLEKRKITNQLIKIKAVREKTIKDLQDTQTDLEETKEAIEVLKNERDVAIISDKSIFGRAGSAVILVIFGILIPAFFAASVHSIVNLGRVDYILFWTSGLGVYYFAGFVWFGFIYFKWGWKPAVAVHILFNCSNILLFFAFMGV